ncbi:MAG: hypothetical protein JSV86_19625 [Gemmatimonadota bacterium]|nr:MAG: hypothetical protein JSV86_19625 [Gemmatimonadota bacterium]
MRLRLRPGTAVMVMVASCVALAVVAWRDVAVQDPRSCGPFISDIAEAYAVALAYPDSFPIYVQQERGVLSEPGLLDCIDLLADSLLQIAEYLPSSEYVYDESLRMAQVEGVGEVGEWFAESSRSRTGSPYLVQLYLRDLATSIRGILAGYDDVYHNTALYRQSTYSWTSFGEEYAGFEAGDRVRVLSHHLNFQYLMELSPGEQAANGDYIPQFPWPPPAFTTRRLLPTGLVTRGTNDTLGVAFDKIVAALERGEIYEWAVYAIGDSGFAVVSKMESIKDDGTPTATRWSLEAPPSEKFWLLEILDRVFLARPGRYRVIVLTVTSLPVVADTVQVSDTTARNWIQHGADHLPTALARVVVPSDARCNALIYEFERPDEDTPLAPVEESDLGAVEHLAGARLWDEDDLTG